MKKPATAKYRRIATEEIRLDEGGIVLLGQEETESGSVRHSIEVLKDEKTGRYGLTMGDCGVLGAELVRRSRLAAG